MPTARPAGPATVANSRVKFPGPQATSRTPSPGPMPSSSRAMRCSSRLTVLGGDPAVLAGVAQAAEPRDLALALDASGVVGRQRGDELRDPVAQLQREVRRGGAHELAHVLDRDLVVRPGALGVLGLAH